METYDTNMHSSSRLAKKIRIAATSIVNINFSAANLETFVGTILSWKKLVELDQKAKKLNEVHNMFHCNLLHTPAYSLNLFLCAGKL